MKISFCFLMQCLMLLACLSAVAGVVYAQPPANQKPSPPTSPTRCFEESVVCGHSESNSGVIGTSKSGVGIRGEGGTNGVIGTSKSGEGILGEGGTNGVHGRSSATSHSGVWGQNTGEGFGVAGSTNGSGAGGMFINHGRGDHIRAGDPNNPVFRVDNNGDVFVRGKLIGQKGDKGDQGVSGPPGFKGDKGEKGDSGPAVTVAICRKGDSHPCPGRGDFSRSPCVVTSGTGRCNWDGDDGSCTVCRQ